MEIRKQNNKMYQNVNGMNKINMKSLFGKS